MKNTSACFTFVAAILFFFFSSCQDSQPKDTTPSETNEAPQNKDAENIKAVADGLHEIGKDVHQIKHDRDSTLQAGKEHFWVYQIGMPTDSKEEAGKAYEKVKSLSNLYVFKKSRGEYYVIKDDMVHSKEQLMDSLGSIEKRIQGSGNRIQMIDLSELCSLRKQPKGTDPVKYKIDGEKKEVECRACE